ncbi:MAG: CHC2 zinc finger domain-containing protein [Candidatus Sedimenticola sp. 20ELBAFRAG]
MADKKQLCTDSNLVDVINSSGVELFREGQVLVGNCPFHEDENHALMVDPTRGHWQCDGICQTGGDTCAWLSKWDEKPHADTEAPVKQPESAGVAVSSVPTHKNNTDQPVLELSSDADEQHVLCQIVDYYYQTLLRTPSVLKYLQKRRIDHSGVLKQFKLGFSDRTLGKRLPLKNRKEGAALRAKLQRLGVLRHTGHETFRGSLVVPTIEDGRVLQVYGRKVTPNLRAGTAQHVSLKKSCSGLFNIDAVRASDEVILCPSFIDALTFWCAGYRNVTCPIDEQGYGDVHVDLLRQLGIKRVLIAFDESQEGRQTTEQLAIQLTEIGIDAYRIAFPVGLDANGYAMASTNPAEVLGDAIRQAQWLGNGIAQESIAEEPVQVAGPEVGEPQGLQQVDITTVEVPSQDDVESMNESAEVPDLPPLPATVSPEIPAELEVEVKDNELIVSLDQRRYRIRGFEKNLSYDVLKINLLVSQGEGLHVDTFDLYATKPRANFIRQAAIELGIKEEIIKKDLAKLLLKLEILQEQNIREKLTPNPLQTEMSEKDRKEAQALLESPNLVPRLLEDLQQCGLVGEETNKLVAYLAVLSRKLDRPLAVMVQSTSAAGKSALMDAVLSLVPDEERIQYSAITGQSLFYMGNFDLRHKVLAISEEEGASNASYALKLLQSEGHLKIASTGKDPVTGRHTTHEYQVTGPVMIFSTTTAIDVDEELLNRCLVLTVSEDQAQTEAIHQWQRYEETLDGLLAHQARDDVLRIHRNAQRLLKPLHVVNPYAEQLTFLSNRTRTRRDHRKYLTLIRSIALLHQYQREVKSTYYRDKEIDYIEVTLEDIALANRIAHEVLGRSLDELPPQTRHLLCLIDEMVRERCSGAPGSRRGFRFTRRDIREYTGWGPTQLTVHLQRLEAMEYLLIHQGGRGRQRVYELLYNHEGEDGSTFLMGLADVKSLKLSGVTAELSESERGELGPTSGGVQTESIAGEPSGDKLLPRTVTPVVTGSSMGRVHPVHRNGSTSHTVREG